MSAWIQLCLKPEQPELGRSREKPWAGVQIGLVLPLCTPGPDFLQTVDPEP